MKGAVLFNDHENEISYGKHGVDHASDGCAWALLLESKRERVSATLLVDAFDGTGEEGRTGR